ERREAPRTRTVDRDGKPFASAESIIAAILDGRTRMRDVDPNHPGLFNIQDTVAMAGQGPIYDRRNERLGKSDIGIILLRKLYERELRKIADGKPIKDWRRSPDKVMLGFKPLQPIS